MKKLGEMGLVLGLATVTSVCGGETSQVSAPRATLFVAPNGHDAWSGRLAEPNAEGTDGPFATLERARDEIRQMKQAGPLPPGGVTVEVRGGIYERERTFELTAEDSGTETAPVVYRARKGEEVRLVGGKVVTNFQPVTDPAVLNRLDEAARGKVLQADLRALGVTEDGTPLRSVPDYEPPPGETT